MLTTGQAAALIAVMAVVTLLTRALPFLLFDRGERPPEVILYLGRVLPPAVMAMLIVYCLRDLSFVAPVQWIPPVAASAVTVAFHAWKHNSLLSIFCGTAVHMLLVQGNFF